MAKRYLALILVIIMTVSMFPAAAFAEEDELPAEEQPIEEIVVEQEAQPDGEEEISEIIEDIPEIDDAAEIEALLAEVSLDGEIVFEEPEDLFEETEILEEPEEPAQEEEPVVEGIVEEPADESVSEETVTEAEEISAEEMEIDEAEDDGLTPAGAYVIESNVTVGGVVYARYADEEGTPAFAFVINYTPDISERLEIMKTVTVDGKEYPVTSISNNAFKDCKKLKSVVIRSDTGDFNIKQGAFEGCSNLMSISFAGDFYLWEGCFKCEGTPLPLAVQYPATSYNNIEGYDWESDNRIVTINGEGPVIADLDEYEGYVDNGIKYRLEGTSAVVIGYTYEVPENVEIPDKVTFDGNDYTVDVIEGGAFWEDYDLKTIDLGKVKEIRSYAFENCIKLMSVTGSSVTRIDDHAFKGCDLSDGVSFPKLEEIEFGVFEDSGLKTFEIADSLYYINDGAFRYAPELEQFTEENENGNIYYCVIDGKLLGQGREYDCFVFAAAPAAELGQFDVPDGVNGIGYEAFLGCNISELYIPSGLYYIGERAFSNCPIEEITFAKDFTGDITIDNNAFLNSSPRRISIYIPDAGSVCPAIKNYKWAADKCTVSFFGKDFFALDKEYVLLEKTGDTATFSLSGDERLIGNAHWEINWHSNEDEDKPCPIELSTDYGPSITATAVCPGMAEIRVEYNGNGISFVKFCRVDVTDSGDYDCVVSATLPVKTATVELFKTDYTKVEVLLEVKQNMIEAAGALIPVDGSMEPDNGVAIESAKFFNSTNSFYDYWINRQFRLRVVDDRYLEIIPTEDALVQGKVLNYKPSQIEVTLANGDKIITPEALSLTFKYTKPAVKAVKPAVFNSFYNADHEWQKLQFTNGEVEAIEPNDNKANPPAWLQIDETSKRITLADDAPLPAASGSGSLNLLLTVKGFAVKQEVTVPVSYKKTAPSFKASPATVQIPYDYNAGFFEIRLSTANAKDNIYNYDRDEGGIGVDKTDRYNIKSAYPGEEWYREQKVIPVYVYLNTDEYGVQTGKPVNGETVKILYHVKDGRSPVEVPVKITVPTKVTLKGLQTSSTLNIGKGSNSTYFYWESASNFNFDKLFSDKCPVITIKKGSSDVTDMFSTKYVFGDTDVVGMSVSYNTGLPKETLVGKYTVTADLSGCGFGLGKLTGTLNIVADKPVTATIKKTYGNIDLSKYGCEMELGVIYSNGQPVNTEDCSFRIEERDKSGKNVIRGDVLFGKEEDQLFVSVREVCYSAGRFLAIQPKYDRMDEIDIKNCTYYLVFNSEGVLSKPAEFRIPITRTAVNLTLNKSSVTVNSVTDKNDFAEVEATVSLKDYYPQNVVFEYPDALDVQYRYGTYNEKTGKNGFVFDIRAAEGAAPGTYTVKVKAGPQYAAKPIKVVLTNADPVVTIKATGAIDVIRGRSVVTVKPTFKNYAAAGNTYLEQELLVYKNGEPFNNESIRTGVGGNIFQYNYESYRGTGEIFYNAWLQQDEDSKYDERINISDKDKYTFKVRTFFDDGTYVDSNVLPLTIKMGAAKLTPENTNLVLSASDQYGNAGFRLKSTDAALNGIEYFEFAAGQKVTIDGKAYPAEDIFEVWPESDDGSGRIVFSPYYRMNVGAPKKSFTATLKVNAYVWGGYTQPAGKARTPNATVTLKVTALQQTSEESISRRSPGECLLYENPQFKAKNVVKAQKVVVSKIDADTMKFQFTLNSGRGETVLLYYYGEKYVGGYDYETVFNGVIPNIEPGTDTVDVEVPIESLNNCDGITFVFQNSADGYNYTPCKVYEIINVDEIQDYINNA